MTDTFLAQCPYCHASFRLQHSQLSVARGSVRCGACLKVFNAASQVTDQQLPPRSAHSTHKSIDPNTAITNQAVGSPPPLFAVDQQDPLENLDLNAELARLEREEQLSKNTTANQPPLSSQQTATATATATNDDWNEELLAQATARPLAGSHQSAIQNTVSTTQSSKQTNSFATEQDLNKPITASRPDANRHYFDAPIQLDWRPKKSPWPGRLLWTTLSLCAALLLVGQYTWHNFTELARQDSTRPWLEVLCPLIDCQLPDKVDVRYIKSSNLLVRNHPTFSGALQVDAIIYNRAPFAQPFPLLELVFSNQHNQQIAKRIFSPNEYLAGELAGQHSMPPQVPIHIALEVLNPSNGVLSYQLNFVSPDSPKTQR